MEGVFEVTFGPTFTGFRRFRFQLYPRLWTPLGTWLDEWETNRLYQRLIAAEKNAVKRDSLEYEHVWEQQEIDERRALYITDRICAAAHRLYIELPPITGRDDDPNWIRTSRTAYGRSYLSRPAVADLRTKIRAEKKARWEPIVRWTGWIAAIGTWASSLF